MKRLSLILIFLLLIVAPGVSFADPVDATVARRVAANFLGVDEARLNLVKTDWETLYVFNGDNCFAIVSADDNAIPLLAYSRNRTFSLADNPVNVINWMSAYSAEIQYLGANSTSSDYVASQWNQLLSQEQHTVQPKTTDTVAPLVQTTWNQSPFYNDLCPYDYGFNDHAVTGCVATAMAQVMKYWNHPAVGRDSSWYIDPTYGFQKAVYDTTHYLWDSMPASLNGNSTPTEINAVATLMYHCGVSVNMTYGSTSGAYPESFLDWRKPNSELAFKKYFRYSSSTVAVSKDDFTESEWCDILRRELRAGRPMLYSGQAPSGGHAFVCDGFDSRGYFHFNWGWGGYCDGFYVMGSLNPAPGGTGGNTHSAYNMDNVAIVGMKPAADTSAQVSVTAVSNNAAYGTVIGSRPNCNRYTDTVILYAHAADGCRFVCWGDGNRANPRAFIATDNFSDTAFFAHLGGDTIGYGSGHKAAAWGGNAVMNWAIRIPASAFGAGRELTQVQVYIPSAGQYELKIHRGGSNAPGGMALTQTYITTEEDCWQTITLNYPINVSYNMPIWIVLSSGNAPYPAACSYYSGNPDGSWESFGSTNSWERRTDLSWMINAILSDTTADYTVSAQSADNAHGTVTGGGTFHYGTAITLTATPAQGWRFDTWSDGVAQNPRTLTVLGDASYTARFTRRSYTVNVISSNPAHGSVDGGGTFHYGDVTQLRAYPADGYVFDHWSVGSTENPYSLFVTDNIDVTAYFVSRNGIGNVDNPDLTVSVDGRIVNVAGSADVELFDMLGRPVTATAKGRSQCTFAVPSAGVYILRVDGAAPQRIVIL